MIDVKEIERKIGVEFENKELLKTCFVHASYGNTHKIKSYDNLEYLGDALLGFVIADVLYKQYGKRLDEGNMSKMRSKITENDSLVEVSRKLQLGEHLLTCVGGEIDYHKKQYADIIEALFAAVYLDKGYDEARAFILRLLADALDAVKPNNAKKADYKTALQELVQQHKNSVIEYEMTGKSGEEHKPIFNYVVKVNGSVMGSGSGNSKREAQQHSAEEAYNKLKRMK